MRFQKHLQMLLPHSSHVNAALSRRSWCHQDQWPGYCPSSPPGFQLNSSLLLHHQELFLLPPPPRSCSPSLSLHGLWAFSKLSGQGTKLGTAMIWPLLMDQFRMASVSVGPLEWFSSCEGPVWSRLLGKWAPLPLTCVILPPGSTPPLESWLFCHWFLIQDPVLLHHCCHVTPTCFQLVHQMRSLPSKPCWRIA